MSQTMPSLVPLLVDDASEDVEVELPGAGPLVDESAAEVSDPAGTVVISGWVMPPKLDAPPPPPQADTLLRARPRRARMGIKPSENAHRCHVRSRSTPAP